MNQDHRPGDKVRILDGPAKGHRALVEFVSGEVLTVIASGGEELRLRVPDSACRNYSAAARKAWNTNSVRSVGRPPGSKHHRITISIRVDSDLWCRFKSKVAMTATGQSEVIEELLNDYIHQESGEVV